MSGQIFISYRRDDSAAWAGRLYDRLSIHFASKQIFMDVDLDAGIDFVEAIAESVGSCDALIAVIGKRWLTATDEDGSFRLENPNDFVRTEIATALKRGIRLIPVLVDGASMPRPHELPDELRSLARRNALEVTHSRFNSDSEKLISSIKRVLALTTREHRKSEPSDHLSIGGDTGPTFTGLTFDEMCELLKREEINLDRLSPEAVSGIENCARQFNDLKPGLLHLLWHHRVALQKGVPNSPEAERLSRLGLVFFDRRTGYVLTDDGKRFLLLMKVRIANGDYQTPDRSDHPIEHEPNFTGLTFEEMRETLRAEDVDLDNLSSGTVSGIKDCVVQFNDSKASLLHVLWYFQDILWGGDRKNPEASEASSLFDRLSGIATLVILHPTAGYSLTDDGKRFLLRLRSRQVKQ
jgi:TIR domain